MFARSCSEYRQAVLLAGAFIASRTAAMIYFFPAATPPALWQCLLGALGVMTFVCLFPRLRPHRLLWQLISALGCGLYALIAAHAAALLVPVRHAFWLSLPPLLLFACAVPLRKSSLPLLMSAAALLCTLLFLLLCARAPAAVAFIPSVSPGSGLLWALPALAGAACECDQDSTALCRASARAGVAAGAFLLLERFALHAPPVAALCRMGGYSLCAASMGACALCALYYCAGSVRAHQFTIDRTM